MDHFGQLSPHALIGGGMMKLVLADDHQVFAEGLGMVLDAEDDIEVLGVAPDGEEALRLLARHLPDVLLLDAHMPRTDLCKVVGTAKASAPGTRVVVLSADTRRQLVDAAIQAGADGFLAKDLMGWQVASHSNRRIAEECFLSLNTVRTHVQNVLVKLGVHSKLEAVAFALEHQVVPGRAGWAPAWGDRGQAV